MAIQQNQPIELNYAPFLDYFMERGDLKRFVEALGVKLVIEARDVKKFVEIIGVKQFVETIGVKLIIDAVPDEELWAALSPERREKLLRLAQQHDAPKSDPK